MIAEANAFTSAKGSFRYLQTRLGWLECSELYKRFSDGGEAG
ncbi:hypothetical protein HNR46_003181 [Haloferula luteola]|uniref:Uncharacterized protein n=1 Tax=Haloferula luteola TaxID=595692 RepID=A0A840V4M4_9BACT|nr:hypothetical protein [Haloferula luteola]